MVCARARVYGERNIKCTNTLSGRAVDAAAAAVGVGRSSRKIRVDKHGIHIYIYI